MNYEKYALSSEDLKNGINNFFTQLLIEAKVQRKDAQKLEELGVEQPTISYLVGQAGSGKTTLRQFIREEKYAKRGECVVELDADKLATFHKYYDELIKLPPDDFYKLTRDFVKPGNKVIHKTVIDNKLNVVKEKVMHRGDADYQELAEFKAGGYNIDINIVAIDGWESFLCCIERDIKLIKNGFDPRRVSRKDHDRMYYPFIQELQEFAKRGLCDSISIYGRGELIEQPRLLYSTDKKSETGLNVDESIRNIENERNRMHREIISNPTKYLDRIREVKEDINEFVEDKHLQTEYFSQLMQLEKEIDNEITINR